MNVALAGPWTTESFLAWEDKQEGRYEFDGSQITEVTGGSRDHQRIVSNLVRLLEDMLDLDKFDVVPEMRVQIGNQIRYPDVSVVSAPVAGNVRTLRDALVLFEVVSPDSRSTDRGDKGVVYAGLPSICRYVVLEQSEASATVLTRTGQGWSETRADDELRLPELGVVLPFAGVYRGIRFG